MQTSLSGRACLRAGLGRSSPGCRRVPASASGECHDFPVVAMTLQRLAAGRRRLARPIVSRYPESFRSLVAASLCAACSSSVEPISVDAGLSEEALSRPRAVRGRAGGPSVVGLRRWHGRAGRRGRSEWLVDSRSRPDFGERDDRTVDASARRGASGPAISRQARPPAGETTGPPIFGHRAASAPTPYDGRQYGGVSFWAAFGAENGPSFGVPFGIVTMDTMQPTCTTSLRRPLHDARDAHSRLATVRAPFRRPDPGKGPAAPDAPRSARRVHHLDATAVRHLD